MNHFDSNLHVERPVIVLMNNEGKQWSSGKSPSIIRDLFQGCLDSSYSWYNIYEWEYAMVHVYMLTCVIELLVHNESYQ